MSKLYTKVIHGCIDCPEMYFHEDDGGRDSNHCRAMLEKNPIPFTPGHKTITTQLYTIPDWCPLKDFAK